MQVNSRVNKRHSIRRMHTNRTRNNRIKSENKRNTSHLKFVKFLIANATIKTMGTF